jgi:ribonuclease VapC
MVFDTSALIAIIFGEPERNQFLQLVEREVVLAISAASFYETSVVAFRKKPDRAILQEIEYFLQDFAVPIIALDAQSARGAREAYLQFGKGYHPAGLNLADCFSYSLAKSRNEPLLFKGGDFLKTDIVPAWRP